MQLIWTRKKAAFKEVVGIFKITFKNKKSIIVN